MNRRIRTASGSRSTAWLLTPLVISACLLNPQGEDPSGNDEVSVGGSATSGGAGGAGQVDAGSPDAAGGNAPPSGGATGSGGDTSHGGAAAAGAIGGSSGGAAGSAAPGPCPPDGAEPEANDALLPESGTIVDTATTGILGSWYTLACDADTVAPTPGAEVAAQDGRICFSGTLPAAPADDADPCWGASVGFDLCAVPEDVSDLPPPQNEWLPNSVHTAAECAVEVTGLSFELTGELPEELRIVFQEAEREASRFVSVQEAGPVCRCVSEVSVDVAPDTPAVDPTALVAIQFLVPASQTAPTEFDFCISRLSVW